MPKYINDALKDRSLKRTDYKYIAICRYEPEYKSRYLAQCLDTARSYRGFPRIIFKIDVWGVKENA